MLKLHAYQKNLVDYIGTHKNVGLFLEPGLGKTLITLSYILKQKQKNSRFQALIIAPLRVIHSTWPYELKQWACFSTLTYTILHKLKTFDVPKTDILLINPDGLDRFFKEVPNCLFDLLVVDESTLFKSPSTKRFKLLKKNLKYFDQRIILTGTPIPNGYLDLWSQIYILDEGDALETSHTRYKNIYFYQQDYKGYVWGLKKGYDRLIQSKLTHCISLKAKNIVELPQRIDRIQHNLLPDALYRQYKQLQKDFIIELNNEILLVPNILVKLIKCQQFSNGCMYAENKDKVEIHTEKIKSLQQLIENLNGERVLILYSFNTDLYLIQKYLSQYGITVLSGATKPKDTQHIIDQWNRQKIPILCAQPASMAHGLNLQYGGHHVIWYGLTYNLETYQQANARIYRQYQKERVIIHHLLTKHTIDEQIYTILTNKNSTQQSFMQTLKHQFI